VPFGIMEDCPPWFPAHFVFTNGCYCRLEIGNFKGRHSLVHGGVCLRPFALQTDETSIAPESRKMADLFIGDL
jgi:hypothetical protein